jgi:hypothetical protein
MNRARSFIACSVVKTDGTASLPLLHGETKGISNV